MACRIDVLTAAALEYEGEELLDLVVAYETLRAKTEQLVRDLCARGHWWLPPGERPEVLQEVVSALAALEGYDDADGRPEETEGAEC